jgi:biopolymer transport protein ExbD
MNKRAIRLDQLVAQLAQDFKYNANLVIYVRADENSKMKDFVALTDACQRAGITRYSIRTEPPGGR